MKTAIVFCFVITLTSTTSSRICAGQAEDEAAIRESVAAYVVAFNQGDAKAIAAQWSPDAVYSNPMTGDEVTGRKAIEEQLVEIFKNAKETKIEVDVNSIRFLSPSVAIEEGTEAIISELRSPAFYPIGSCAKILAEKVAGYFNGNTDPVMEVYFDDRTLLSTYVEG